MKTRALGPVLALMVVAAGGTLWSRPASAKLLEFYGQLGAGGAVGNGIKGDAKDADFFKGVGGFGYGGLVGVEILLFDVWISHDQFLKDGGVSGTWTEFMFGGDTDFQLGEKLYLDLGVSVGFGVGTGQQVMPPLDNAQVTDKGFVAEGRLGIDYRLGANVSVGITAPVTWGYLVKNGPGIAVNDSANRYQSLSIAPMVYLRLRFEPFADDDAKGQHEATTAQPAAQPAPAPQ